MAPAKDHPAWLPMIARSEATGELRSVYDGFSQRRFPAVYATPHGDAPYIVRVHSLDAPLMGAVFGFSATLWTDDTLSWPRRELVNAVTSRLNQCFY